MFDVTNFLCQTKVSSLILCCMLSAHMVALFTDGETLSMEKQRLMFLGNFVRHCNHNIKCHEDSEHSIIAKQHLLGDNHFYEVRRK